MSHHSKQNSGFTLLELMVAISIAGILMAMAIPSFKDAIRNNRLTTYTNDLVTSLNIARSETITRGVPVSVAKIRISTTTTASYWSVNGWNVFVDNNNNGTLDTGELVLRTYPAFPTGYMLMANNFPNYITYKADGTSNTIGSFTVCDSSDGNDINNPPKAYTSKLITINRMGRIHIGTDSNKDGIPEKDGTTTNIASCVAP